MARRISVILILVMVLLVLPFNSLAEDNYDKQLEEAILRSKQLFSIGDEYDQFDHNVSYSNGTTIFYLNWSDSKGKLDVIDVSITTDGTVISFSKWKPVHVEEKPKLPNISKEEGLNIAKDFIEKVAPKFIENVKYIDIDEPLNINSNDYSYYFVRTENGIPYYNNNIHIYVNNKTGEIRNYYANWDMNLKFSSAKDLIPLEKAQELYKEKIGLDLVYKTNYIDRKPNSFLAYSPLNMNLGINAKNGEVTPIYDYIYLERSLDMGAGEVTSTEELSPSEKQAVEKISGIISQKNAEKIARDILKLDSDYKLNYFNLYKDWTSDEDYIWQLEFRKDIDSNNYHYVNISMDAKTKELISFYKFGPDDPNKKIKYNKEECLEIAKEYIKLNNPDKLDLIEFREGYDFVRPLVEQKIYYFNFVRKVDSAYVEGDGISATVDATSGDIIEYRIDWSKIDFPAQDNLITKDRAYNILFGDIGLELKYINPNIYGSFDNKEEAILVYGLKTDKPAIIDAKTGTLLNYRGEPFKSRSVISYKDIDNSYAKDKINILAQFGIALPGEEFKPKEKITQSDFLYLLAKANNPYFEIEESRDNLYSLLINLGIIKEGEISPEKIVTKEEAIKYVIRALKYDKIADLTEIYKDLFKDTEDIAPELKGYVSIAYGLKIVEGYNGYLNPKAQLKREDGANIIYNYLFNGI